MGHRIYLYPVWIRLWHVVNLLLFIVLIGTGIAMQYASATEGSVSLISFESAVAIHNIAAVILTIGYVIYFGGNIVTGNGKHYKIKPKGYFTDLMKQFQYYALGMFRKEEHPFPVSETQKFNPLQKFAYVLAMYVGMPLLIVTGLAFFFPEVVPNRMLGTSGLMINALLHAAMGFVLSMFMIIHVYTCTLGRKPTTLFKSMATGYHEH